MDAQSIAQQEAELRMLKLDDGEELTDARRESLAGRLTRTPMTPGGS